jgi:hypothetical protein
VDDTFTIGLASPDDSLVLTPGLALEELATLSARQVEGTPTLFIGTRRVIGARPVEALAAVVEEALRAAP